MTPEAGGPWWAPLLGASILCLFVAGVALLLHWTVLACRAAARFHRAGMDRLDRLHEPSITHPCRRYRP